MDDNNLLKCFAPIGNRNVGDVHTFESDYWLSMEFINKFAGKVKGHQGQPHVTVPEVEENDADSEWEDENGKGDPTDSAPESACTTNWKVVALDEKKCAWSAFHKTGIFASYCHYGVILRIIDMIWSGEL